jgi:hypothetical protein
MVDEWHLDVALGRPGKPDGALINIDGGTSF